jgi:plastocyanin
MAVSSGRLCARWCAAGVASLLVALAVAGPAAASSKQTVLVQDNEFAPRTVRGSVGPSEVAWVWDGPLPGPGDATNEDHNVVQNRRLFSSGAAVTDDAFSRIPSAGTFPYFCEVHRFTDGMTGRLRIMPSRRPAPAGPPFRVVWATPDSNTGDEFDVRFKVGGGAWRTWRNDTSRLSGVFGRNDNPVEVRPDSVYRFQARSQQNPERRSGWSPILTVST